jgi:hypothetical protein
LRFRPLVGKGVVPLNSCPQICRSTQEFNVPIVFVVDRVLPRRTSLQSRLTGEGYHTLAMTDADEALQTLGCVRADLLVVDVHAVQATPSGSSRRCAATRPTRSCRSCSWARDWPIAGN